MEVLASAFGSTPQTDLAGARPTFAFRSSTSAEIESPGGEATVLAFRFAVGRRDFDSSSRGGSRDFDGSGTVAPEAREGLKGAGGDAGFAEATQALDKEW